MARRPTSTSSFGVSRRESHDASDFYRRFTAPEVSSDCEVASHRAVDKLIVGDARRMDEVPDSSVALVVTSPPYFAGKEYEASLGERGVPATYLDYLQLLRDVFAECVRKLEPGGRLAVNVANLGRRPYRSLSADVIGILQDDLRLLLRGEIIWLKQRGSAGSCAWGSFQRPGNPVLRDLTERVIVASKGRFDRAVSASVRARRGLPSESSMTRDDFMENTLDVWEIPAERASSVGHPAPFPAELPARLIELHTYRGDLVLDPFVGSGTTAVAAVRSGRHFAGYDQNESYIARAEARVEEERRRMGQGVPAEGIRIPVSPPGEAGGGEAALAGAIRQGRAAKEVARVAIAAAGFAEVLDDQRLPGGIEVSFIGHDRHGNRWLFDVAGPLTTHRAGLRRPDALWRAIAKAAVARSVTGTPLVLLTAGVPAGASAGADTLRRVTGPGQPIAAVIDLLNPSGLQELRGLCLGGAAAEAGTTPA